MKNLTFLVLLLSIASVSCSSGDKETRLFITDFFTSHAKFTCIDSINGKVQLRFLHNQINMEIMSFEFVIPDSIRHSNFYNAYIGRIVETYYKSLAAQENGNIDSLFLSQNCDVVDVKNNIIDYYTSDEVFSGVFKTALSSYFENKKNLEKDRKFDKTEKIEFSLDSLIQISLIQFDIVDYDPKRGFAYHFVCGINPYEYSIQNRDSLLIPGFCQEA